MADSFSCDQTAAATSPEAAAVCRLFWLKTRRLTWAVLLVWFCFNVTIVWFAKPFSAITLWGVPVGFLNLSLFSLLLFTLLATLYAILVNHWARAARQALKACCALPTSGHGD